MIRFRRGREFTLDCFRIISPGCNHPCEVKTFLYSSSPMGTVLHSGTGLHWRVA